MTMTPWNLTHGQCLKNLTMATDILESAAWSMVRMVILWSKFMVKSWLNNHFDHRKFVFLPWPWSKWVFLWLNLVIKFQFDHFDHGKFGLRSLDLVMAEISTI